MGELLRAIFGRTSTKIALAVGALIAAALFLSSGLQLGAAADDCATRLVTAANTKDDAALRDLVKTPSMRARLLREGAVELAFVRPVSPGWSRVGLFVKTSTSQDLMPMQLEAKDGACQFLRDY